MAGKGKREKSFLFTFDSLVQSLGAVDHWSNIVMSQVQSSNSNSSSCAHAVIYCVHQQRWVLSNVLFLYVSMQGAAHTQALCLWTESPRAEPAC